MQNSERKILLIFSNYGPTLEYYKKVSAQGYQQILWLNEGNVTEVGVMNFFVYWINKKGKRELVTCCLNGTILPGVMRHTILELANSWDITTDEREIHIDEIIEAIEEGRMLEAFGSGTAAIICPIKSMNYNGKVFYFF
jgi:branched-chain amino acid aminotransferase